MSGARPPAHVPVEIDLDRQRALRIRWADGAAFEIALAALRRACPCAGCRATREEEAAPGRLPVIKAVDERALATAESAELVGHYALRIVWRDGHRTGIYDYALLRSLGEAGKSVGNGFG